MSPATPAPTPAQPVEVLSSESASLIRHAIHCGYRCLACNNEKRSGFYFCGPCYNRLPDDMKTSLFNHRDNVVFLAAWAKLFSWLTRNHPPRKVA